MSYVNYRQELYRTGFRPYAQTDPFAASQLNGLGQVHPFGPWVLHGYDDGLGQVHPFTESGGWPLHGLGSTYGMTDFLKAGQQYTIELTASGPPGSAPPDSDLASAMQAIPQFGGTAIVTSGLLSSGISITFTLAQEEFVSTLQAEVMGTIAELYPLATINWLTLHDGSAANPYGAGSSHPYAAPSLSSWFQDNAMWIGLAAGLLLLSKVL